MDGDDRDPDGAQTLRELARGVRRRLSLLQDAGIVGGYDLRSGPAAPATAASISAPENTASPAPHAPEPADDTRRSIISERGAAPRSPQEKAAAMSALDAQVRACRLCRLCEGRKNAVPGEGNLASRVLFVGEGPGATEDSTGRPFVGAAGQLLTRIIEAGMGLKRSDVYIANIVKCRPPENRDPQPDEVAACVPFLLKQIEILDPEVIIPLGRHSMRELAAVGERDTITRVRGNVFRLHGRAVIPTFHPAYLIRNPEEKVKVWHDIQLAMKELGLPLPKPRNPNS